MLSFTDNHPPQKKTKKLSKIEKKKNEKDKYKSIEISLSCYVRSQVLEPTLH